MTGNVIWSLKKLLSGLSHADAKNITDIALRDRDEISMKALPICNDVLKRLASLFNTETDIELAKALGVANNTISGWRTRNKIPYERLVDLSVKENINLETLIFGQVSAVKTPIIDNRFLLENEDGLACEQFKTIELAPCKSLYNKVRASFVLNDSSIGKWCTANKVAQQNVMACLVGSWDGEKAKELRSRLIIASSLLERPQLMEYQDE